MEHALAAVLADGKVQMPYVLPFSDAGALDPRYERARSRVKMVVRDDLPPGLATGAAPPVTVRLKSGATLTETAVGLFRGSPENPLDDDELLDRYHTCAAHTLSPAAVERTSEILLNLEQCSDLSELMRIGTFGR
jgi:2-methylcitrate dehydratase PrpD